RHRPAGRAARRGRGGRVRPVGRPGHPPTRVPRRRGRPVTPALLLDTCAIINLSDCGPVAALFRDRYTGRAGWVRAVRAELTAHRVRRPPHPQAGRAHNWATSWLGEPIDVTDAGDQLAVVAIQNEISLGGDDALAHLGEAASIHVLAVAGSGRLIS